MHFLHLNIVHHRLIRRAVLIAASLKLIKIMPAVSHSAADAPGAFTMRSYSLAAA
jgi:hypothetical protein